MDRQTDAETEVAGAVLLPATGCLFVAKGDVPGMSTYGVTPTVRCFKLRTNDIGLTSGARGKFF